MMKQLKTYGILSQLGYIYFKAKNKKEAEKQFSKDYDLEKYPVNLIKNPGKTF